MILSRRALLILALMSVSTPVFGRQDKDLTNPKKWPVVLKGEHYQVWSTAAEMEAQEYLQFMELVYATYTTLLDLPRPPVQKMVIILYKNREEYLAGGAPQGSAAYYNGTRLVGYRGDKGSFAFFAHEGFHQFTHWGLKAIHKAPLWFTEGMADCIGNHEVRNGRFYVCVKDGPIAQGRIGVIQNAITKNEALPLPKLLELDRAGFMARAGLYYPQAWSFCHFLMSYPQVEDPKNQVPHGKYWKVLQRYILAISDSATKPARALELAFTDEKGKPLDLQVLEKEWKEYVLAFPLSPSPVKK